MTKDLLGHLRRATFSLVVILVVALVLVEDRLQLRSDLDFVEVRHLALRAKRPHDIPRASFERFVCQAHKFPLKVEKVDEETGESGGREPLEDCSALFDYYSGRSLVELVVGLMSPSTIREDYDGDPRRLAYFGSDMEFARSGREVNFLKSQDALEVAQEIHREPKSRDFPSAGILATPDECTDQEQSLWFLTVGLQGEAYVSQPAIVISNAKTLSKKGNGELCTVTGPVEVYAAADLGEMLELRSFKSYEHEIGRVGWRWGLPPPIPPTSTLPCDLGTNPGRSTSRWWGSESTPGWRCWRCPWSAWRFWPGARFFSDYLVNAGSTPKQMVLGSWSRPGTRSRQSGHRDGSHD